MVKALTVLAFLAAPTAYVMAQDASVPTEIPSNIPTDDPGLLSSIASYASENAGELSSAYESIMSELPTDYQNSVSSILAEATQGAPSGGSDGESAGNKVTLGVAMAGAVGFVAAAGMLL
ncbi:hypothetical protein BDB00DRAFT_849229 [Zychaea mexicana]|uniref:uncharacterized protein n=1 Tax=Zychaea mexicana TaxID=64656 RepID=UPI0022FE2A9E|nr:uncharacterized protein BDB00DRAFT_849229 [Zychaea mexicana]KAI9488254.1 hypothetical protein BDB00DRAFT_849229 [Zychaea mexicana]